MSKLIDPEFAKSLIEDCEKIIATLKQPEPKAEKSLAYALKQAGNDWEAIPYKQRVNTKVEALAKVATQYFLEKAEKAKLREENSPYWTDKFMSELKKELGAGDE